VRPHFGRLGLLRRARPDPEACPAVPRRAHEHRGIHALQKIDRESQRERVRERARERESERESERERRVRAREKSAAPLRKAVPPLGTGLGFKAHRLVYHSTLGWSVTKKKEKLAAEGTSLPPATSTRKSHDSTNRDS